MRAPRYLSDWVERHGQVARRERRRWITVPGVLSHTAEPVQWFMAPEDCSHVREGLARLDQRLEALDRNNATIAIKKNTAATAAVLSQASDREGPESPSPHNPPEDPDGPTQGGAGDA